MCRIMNPYSSLQISPLQISRYGWFPFIASLAKAQKAALWSWHYCLRKQHGHYGSVCLGYITAYVSILHLLTLICIWTKEHGSECCSGLVEEKKSCSTETSTETSTFFLVLQEGVGGIGCCTYCLTLQMLQLQMGKSGTSLSLSRESQKQSSLAAGSFRANGSDSSVIEHQAVKRQNGLDETINFRITNLVCKYWIESAVK